MAQFHQFMLIMSFVFLLIQKGIYYFEEFKHLGISRLRNQKLRLNVKAQYIPII